MDKKSTIEQEAAVRLLLAGKITEGLVKPMSASLGDTAGKVYKEDKKVRKLRPVKYIWQKNK